MRFPSVILICFVCLTISRNSLGYSVDESAVAEASKLDAATEQSFDLKSEPILSIDRPEWVAAEDRLTKTVHRVSVGTELFDTVEGCRAHLDEAILNAAHRYANEHLLPERAADRLKQFSVAWIREHWLVPGKEWEAVLERPSGTYHQLWVELEVFPEDQKQVVAWFQELEMLRRCVFSLVLCLGIGGIAGVLNFGLRFLKRYEKPERQS